MRLHRVRLRDYRGVNDCEVVFSVEGVTVVEGPNEIGKTSIPEALDLILEVMDSSSARRVKSVGPVGRDAGPDVEVEMSSGDYRFVYRKRWLRARSTTLAITSPRHEQINGREAHQRVTEILGDTLDKDLWDALRIDQGTKLALPGFGATSLGRALDQAAGSELASGREDNLWDRICDERLRYWTAQGRPKGDRKSSEAGVSEAKKQVAEIQAGLREIEDAAAEVRRLSGDESRLARTLDDCKRQEDELGEQWAAAEKLSREADRLRADHEAKAAQRDRLAGDQQSRQELAGSLNERATDLSGLEAEAERAAPSLTAARQLAEDAEDALTKSRDKLRAAKSEQRRANEDRDHNRRQIEVAQLTERHDRVTEAETALREAETQLEAARVDGDLLGEIEQAHLDTVAADAAVASIETTALRDVSLQIDGENTTLAVGESKRTVVDDEIELVIADSARVRVTAGTGNKSLAVERSNAHDTLARLCEMAGVADLAEARRAAERHQAAERNREGALATIRRDLRDLTVEDLGRKIRGLSGRIDRYAAERPAEPPMPTDLEESRRIADRAERVVADRKEEFETCESTARGASEQRQEARLQHATLSAKIESARDAHRMAKSKLDAARQELSDADIAGRLAAAQQKTDASKETLEKIEAELEAADPGSLEVELQNARAAARRADDDLRSNKVRQNELHMGLEFRGEQGLHTRLDEAVSRHEHLAHEHERTEARAEAARLLHATFDERRREARRRYVEPFKQRIERLGRIVFNKTFEVDLDDDLRIVRRTLDGDTLRVDQLSTGALEQLGVLSRLACAAIVSPDGGGAPVVIDDALGWSDPDRLKSMGAAIAAAGGQCQVIILTCTPGRYAHVGNATTIRLPSGS